MPFSYVIKWLSWVRNVLQSHEIQSTLLVVLIMLLKLFVNNRATELQKKMVFVSIPGEITVLIVGFLMSANVTNNPDQNNTDISPLILISFILLIWLYVSERYLEDKLSGNWSLRTWGRVILMFVFSGALFYFVVFLGGIV